jgi:hypothetical protein
VHDVVGAHGMDHPRELDNRDLGHGRPRGQAERQRHSAGDEEDAPASEHGPV